MFDCVCLFICVCLFQFPSESLSFQLTLSIPEDACEQITNDVKNKVVLVKRGNCEFVKKAEEVQFAGGHAVLLGSTYPYIVRMVRMC